MERVGHAVQAVRRIHHGGLGGDEGLAGLQPPRERVRVHADGQAAVFGVVHVGQRLEAAGVDKADRPDLAGELRGAPLAQREEGIGLVAGRAALAEDAVFALALRLAHDVALARPRALQVNHVVAAAVHRRGGGQHAVYLHGLAALVFQAQAAGDGAGFFKHAVNGGHAQAGQAVLEFDFQRFRVALVARERRGQAGQAVFAHVNGVGDIGQLHHVVALRVRRRHGGLTVPAASAGGKLPRQRVRARIEGRERGIMAKVGLKRAVRHARAPVQVQKPAGLVHVQDVAGFSGAEIKAILFFVEKNAHAVASCSDESRIPHFRPARKRGA